MKNSPGTRLAYGRGIATVTTGDVTLDVWYPEPVLGSPSSAALSADSAALPVTGPDPDRQVAQHLVLTRIDLDAPPINTADAYLRLHLLSHRLVRPNTLNLDGIFGVLPNVVWTNYGPCAVQDFATIRRKLRMRGPVQVFSVDKFPRLVDYHVPSNVRIADADRVRLGAYLAEGTTVMHEGFVNFNAGTLGPSMIEGRVSSGVVIDHNTDIGGGASIMGTLSGGGSKRLTIGKHVLLGANAGVGISLGDHSVVEAGLYVTAGTLVRIAGPQTPDGENTEQIVKAAQLSGRPHLLFRRNSTTGEVEALHRPRGVELNAALHAH